MPTIEQLNATVKLLGFMEYKALSAADRAKVMELTIAAIQAKALADIAYIWGFQHEAITGRKSS